MFSYYTGATVKLLEGKYLISKPIILYGDNKISEFNTTDYNLATRVKGCGKKRTFIIKNTNTTSGLNDHNVDAIFIIAGSIYIDGTYSTPGEPISDENCVARGIKIEDLTLWGKGNSYNDYSNYCTYGIFGISLYHSELKEINIFRCNNGIAFTGWSCYDLFTTIQVNFAEVGFNFGIHYAAQTTCIFTQCHGNGIRSKVFYLRGGHTLIDCIQDGGLGTFLYCDRVVFSSGPRVAHINCLRLHAESRSGTFIYSEGAMITVDDVGIHLSDPQYTTPTITAKYASNIVIRRITGACVDKSYKAYKFADVDKSSWLILEDGYITNAWFNNYTKIYGRGMKEIINPQTEFTYFMEWCSPSIQAENVPTISYTRTNNELVINTNANNGDGCDIVFMQLKNKVDLTDVQKIWITVSVSYPNPSIANAYILCHLFEESYEDGYYVRTNVPIPHINGPIDDNITTFRGNMTKRTLIFDVSAITGEYYLGLFGKSGAHPTVTVYDGYLI